MVEAILSIKPVYCDRIKSGEKRYEFRKAIFRRPVSQVHIYATSPCRKIVGSFRVGGIMEDSPARLWERCKEYSGINREDFFSYFKGRDVGYAIQIVDPVFVEPYDPKLLNPDFVSPQSFCYLP
jgi:type I restriction enzyme S subunit